ncbi:MAG TPA: FadR/GntR family transcriptional regulator [Clostridiaceae bacterium]
MFTPVKNTKVYEGIVDQIKEMINNGTLGKGDRLPPERELVGMFKVSRASIREALRSLEILGLIECKHGEGNFVNKDSEKDKKELLSLVSILEGSKAEEVLSLGKAIQEEAASEAAGNISHKQILEIGFILQILKTTKDSEVYLKMDKEFLSKLVKASSNSLLINLYESISSLLDVITRMPKKEVFVKEENRLILRVEYESIYKAISEHNPEAAARAVRTHLEFVNQFIIKSELFQ